jgi:hypothetical protein
VSFSKLAFYHAVDNMKPEDVGLTSELQFFRPTNVLNGDSRVTYTTIYKCDNFSVRLACSALVGSKYSFCVLHELKIRLMNHPVTFLPKKIFFLKIKIKIQRLMAVVVHWPIEIG